jgi:putative ABC transport system ATP-binding protein
MLVFEDVHKAYTLGAQRVHALRGVSLRIDEPGFFAIMGRSGSGKSTLLHLAAGLDRPDRGRVLVDGEDLGTLSETQLTNFRRGRLGIVFQKFNLISTMTAFQNAALPGVIDGRSRAWIERRVGELFEALEISNRADHRPDAMSGGEQQRVAIARAMLFSPAVLLADEPTGNLDSASSERLWRLLGSIARQQNVTVVMVTHEPAAAAHCQRVFVIADGAARGDFEVNGLDQIGVASRYQQLGG